MEVQKQAIYHDITTSSREGQLSNSLLGLRQYVL